MADFQPFADFVRCVSAWSRSGGTKSRSWRTRGHRWTRAINASPVRPIRVRASRSASRTAAMKKRALHETQSIRLYSWADDADRVYSCFISVRLLLRAVRLCDRLRPRHQRKDGSRLLCQQLTLPKLHTRVRFPSPAPAANYPPFLPAPHHGPRAARYAASSEP